MTAEFNAARAAELVAMARGPIGMNSLNSLASRALFAEVADQLETASVEVAGLTTVRDVLRASLGEACHLIGGMIIELSRYEDDPSMLDGHRARVAEFMRKLVQS